MVSRGVVKLIDDAKKCQTLQAELLADEVRSDIERFEDYGMTSHPPVDSELLFVAIGGNRSNGIAVRVFDRSIRPTGMADGDVCLYTADGERVYINKADDIVHLGAKSATALVALVGSTVTADTTMSTWISAVTSAINALAPGSCTLPTDFGSVADGATKVKAT